MKILFRILGGFFALILVFLAGAVAYGNYGISRDETQTIEAQAPGRFFTVEGRRLHVLTVGDVTADPTGVPLLVVHGFIEAGHASLMPWAPEKLGAKRALILPDLLGYGYSERNTTPGEHYTLKSYARYLAGVLDRLGVKQVDYVGHSYGSAVGARFALDYPERVRRMVFMSPGLYMKRTSTEGVVELPLGIGRAVAWYMLGSGPVSMIPMFCEAKPDCPMLPPTHIRDTTDTVRAMMYTSRHTPDLEQLYVDIPSIMTPAMVLWGADDQIVTREMAGRLAHDLGIKLSVVPNARHMPYRQQPDEVAKRVLEFLGTGS